jgi:hypothetical protein
MFSLSVVNRWDAVVFEVQRDFTPSLATLPWTATEFSLKTPSSQHPSVAQVFHSWKRVVFQIPPDGLASERLSVGIETKFAQGRN